MKVMKNKELMLLACLRDNCRKSITELHKRIKMPQSTIYDKIKQFESSIISKYVALVDFTKFGFFAKATIALKVAQNDREKIREHLMKHHYVNTLYKINNGFDFQVECVFKHIKGLEEFIEELNAKFKIKQCVVFYIIDELKRESFLSCPEIVEMIVGE